MNARLLIYTPLLSFVGPLLLAQSQRPPEPPPPVVQTVPRALPDARPENQRLYGPTSASLVAPEIAQQVVERFRAAYSEPAAPRLVFYVNRELVDLQSGLKLMGKTEKYETVESKQQSDMTAPAQTAAPQTQVNVTVGGNSGQSSMPAVVGQGTASSSTAKISGENTYQLKDRPAATLADQQTVREVERLFGRAFRTAGARLADPTIARSLLPEEPGTRLVSDHAAKDREALTQVADIAIEILISSRNLTIATVSGEQTLAVPDIQATAIRLKDAAIVGQASASDVLGKDREAGRVLRNFDVRDITEATALALMEDMLLGAK